MRRLTSLVLFVLLLILGIPASLVQAATFPASSADYFPTTEGTGIKYHVTDTYGTPLDCSIWAVSQYVESGKPDSLDFMFTFVKEGTAGGYFRDSAFNGWVSLAVNGRSLTVFGYGTGGNQADFYREFCLPTQFSPGDTWSYSNRQYSIEAVGAQTVNGVEFADCIKVNVDDSANTNSYSKGTGYFILAHNVGIVKLVFQRTAGGTVTFEYVTNSQLTRHSISGVVIHNGIPVQNMVVQLTASNWGNRSVTDSSGAFTIRAYGPDVTLLIGYDLNNDDKVDHPPTMFMFYTVNGVASDITGISVNLLIVPYPVTNPASSITDTSAILNGSVLHLGTASTASVYFQYGLTTSYGHTTPTQTITGPGDISAAIANLTQGTTYHYQLKAIGDGPVVGSDATFTTSGITPPTLVGADYFPITQGYSIKYHVTDNRIGVPVNSGDAWFVSQYVETGKPYTLDFLFTLTQEGAQDTYLASSLGGRMSFAQGINTYIVANAGIPTSIQGYLLMDLMLPDQFVFGDHWSYSSRNYTVLDAGSQTIGGRTFTDCAKVTIDDPSNATEYLRGTGYFILAKNVGLIQFVFNRYDGTTVTYNYLSTNQFVRHTVSGNVTFKGVPAAGLILQIATSNSGTRAITDANGAFSMQFYGPDIALMLGYDTNNDNVLDTTAPFPRIRYPLKNIFSDVSGLAIDLVVPPSATTTAAANVTTSSATLNANLLTLGTSASVQVSFQYGLTTAYGQTTTPQTMTNTGAFSTNIISLMSGTTYHFRAKATSDDGTYYDGDMAFTTSGTPAPQGAGTDYFPTTEGYGIKYHVTDTYLSTPTICDIWMISQYKETGKPYALDFFFTLVKEGTSDGNFPTSSRGGYFSQTYIYSNYGYPSMNQGTFLSFSLPRQFTSGNTWSSGTRQYSVVFLGAQTIAGVNFEDCIKVTVDDSNSTSTYSKGTGYFILAKGTGIVELVFNRADGSTVHFTYADSQQFTRHTISGTVTLKGTPAAGLLVQLATANWGTRSIVGSDGTFSIQAYGPDVTLMFGYDANNDNIFDVFPSAFRGTTINGVYSDISGIAINLIVGPYVTTAAATNITAGSATLNGNMPYIGTSSSAQVSFQYGLTTAYGLTTSPQTMTGTGTFSIPVTGLIPNTTYHFRAKATSDDGSYIDGDMTFTTANLLVSSISPASIAAGGTGFILTLTGVGFSTGSTVYWRDESGTTPLATTLISTTQLSAAIPAQLTNVSKTAEIYVRGADGAVSNWLSLFVTDTSASVSGSNSATSPNSSGTATATVGGTGPSTPGSLTATATGSGTVVVAQYATDPGGTPSFQSTGAYFDVYTSLDSNFSSVSIVFVSTNGGNVAYWWNGTGWVAVSNQTYDPASSSITIIVTNDTSPSLADLRGCIFGIANSPVSNPVTLFMHDSASSLTLDTNPPTGAAYSYKDSSSLNRTTYKEIGTWKMAAMSKDVKLSSLGNFTAWIGLKNSDDQGTYFDIKVDIFKNGVVITTAQLKDIKNVTRNADKATKVTISLGTISDSVFHAGDVLSIKVSAKVADSGGHNSAVGLRFYSNSVSYPSSLEAKLEY